jgi:HSP90 family molecular chaperone
MSLLTIYVKGELQSKTKKKHVKQLFLQEVFINDDISDFSPNSDVTGRKER